MPDITKKLYWVSAIVFDEKNDKKPWLCGITTGNITLDEAKGQLNRLKETRPLLSAWIDDGEGNVFVHECYIDTFGNKSKQ